jgi:hypothetical protein
MSCYLKESKTYSCNTRVSVKQAKTNFWNNGVAVIASEPRLLEKRGVVGTNQADVWYT